ncbi:MAG: DUF1822 family protein [Rhodocyclaceae bacterium]|nr:DUF1822 family protein [Rhodocyclaceae bacterium]
MADIPTTEPTTVNAGDTVRWLRKLPEYPASDGWVLTYTVLNASGKITITASANGDDHFVSVPATTSASWPAGEYAWRARVSRAGDVYTVAEGRITVRPSFAEATLDARSTARRALEAVEAYLADPNNVAAAQYEIAGRQLRRYTLTELWMHRDRLKLEVLREEQAERSAAGLPDRRRVLVRFGA